MARKKQTEEHEQENVVVTAAKAVGDAAGKIAALAGATPERPQTPSAKKGKLQKKNGSRLPRRQKKAQQKLASQSA